MARTRIIGTVEQALEMEEALLQRKLPGSFRDWLLKYNSCDLEGLRIFPVRDERDTRKTWESLAHHMRHEWAEWLQNFTDGRDFSALLPFADCGTGDYYCFDYSLPASDGERPVVRWSHETGNTELCAKDFQTFLEKIRDGELNH